MEPEWHKVKQLERERRGAQPPVLHGNRWSAIPVASAISFAKPLGLCYSDGARREGVAIFKTRF